MNALSDTCEAWLLGVCLLNIHFGVHSSLSMTAFLVHIIQGMTPLAKQQGKPSRVAR